MWEVADLAGKLTMLEKIYNVLLLRNYIQFLFQLIVCEIPFLIGMKKRKDFSVRVVAGVILTLLLSWGWLKILEPLGSENFMLPYVFLYIGYAVFSGLGIRLAFDVPWMEIVFVVAAGYATEHMCFAVSRMGLYLLKIPYATSPEHIWHALITRYAIFPLAALIIYFAVVKGNKKKMEFENSDLRIAVLAAILMLTAIAISVYWSYDSKFDGTKVGGMICPAYSFICCAFMLVLAYRVLWEKGMQKEHEKMEEMLRMSDIQQKSAKEAIDIINIKCHDLKHQLRALEKLEDEETRADYLKEITGAISIYDATYNTGFRPLDYVLREKSLLFNEYQVEFSCMAEGTCIEFMTAADVYALFGNALDNALECVQEEKAGERFISLHLTRRGEMVIVHVENRCSRNVQFQDGFPVTHKKDKTRHGFGVRSIVYIAEKYDGQVFMKVQEGKYLLDILFPEKFKSEFDK